MDNFISAARRSRELFIASIARHRFPLPLPNAARRIVKAGWVIRNWLETERARSAGGGRGGEKEWGAFSSSKVNAAEVLARREEEGWMERKGRNIAACLLRPPLCIRLAFRIYISFRFVLLLYIFRSSIVKWRADVGLECALSFAACTQI